MRQICQTQSLLRLCSYMLYLEEEHRRRIEEEQQANRERYERKMMRKGYK